MILETRCIVLCTHALGWIMKESWLAQWFSGVLVFSVSLMGMYADGFFAETADGPGFWVMIGVVITLVSVVLAVHLNAKSPN